MNVSFAHVNIVAQDWRGLVSFYKNVFGCVEGSTERSLSGKWLDEGVGLKDVKIEGIHLKLPGSFGENSPTLEIFSYNTMEEKPSPSANRKGFGHIAFLVDDVKDISEKVVSHGGKLLGKIIQKEYADGKVLTFVYAADPEGNILELQHWKNP